ncbi:MAG TPA: LUD domain-containing protein [Trebonia sp.]|nr:LUD domain-containing protein [Trebonia sp.]
MNEARQQILARIRSAGVAREVEVPRAYRGPGATAVADVVTLFAGRVADYRAAVRRCPADEVRDTIGAALSEHGASRVVVPADFPERWRPLAAVADDPPLSVADLDGVDAVLTTCAVAIASTGTIVLDHGPGQGRRALTLVPDYHLVVVEARQIVAAVPDGVTVLDATRPQTWISGPSATSDIELSRVEGVHGPRRLEVIVSEPSPPHGP